MTEVAGFLVVLGGIWTFSRAIALICGGLGLMGLGYLFGSAEGTE